MDLGDLRPLGLFDGLRRRPAARADRGGRRGVVRPGDELFRGGCSPPTSGGCSSTAGSTWCATSAARRRCSGPWTRPAGGPVGSAPGTSTGSTSRPGRASVAGRILRVPAAALRRRGRVPGSRSAHTSSRAVPDGPQLRVRDTAAGGPGRPRHPGGRTRARDQQPGRSGDPGGGRPRRRVRDAAVLPRTARGSCRSPRTSSPRSTRCVRSSSHSRARRTRWPSPTGRTPCRPGCLATASSRTG